MAISIQVEKNSRSKQTFIPESFQALKGNTCQA